MAQTDRLLTVPQCAKRLGVCHETIRRAIRKGALEARRDTLHLGGPFMVSEIELERFRQTRWKL